VYKHGASAPESIQSLTCLLLQHPPGAAMAMHFTGQLSGRHAAVIPTSYRDGRVLPDLRQAISAANLPR
jgi:hypothetical protein